MTTRNLTSGFQTAVAAEVIRPVLLVELDWPSGKVYATSAPMNITVGGNTYFGIGNLGSISAAREGTDTQADVLTLTITGVPTGAVAQAINDNPQLRLAIVSLALFDANYQLVADPAILYQGTMDTPNIEMGTTGTITVPIINTLADWERPRGGRFTDDEQESRFPGDKFFEFVPQMVDAIIIWGRV